MAPRAKRIFFLLSMVILFASIATSLDRYFVSPDFLRSVDLERAEEVASEYGASCENAAIRASDGSILKGWLFIPQIRHDRAVLLVHGGLGNRHEDARPRQVAVGKRIFLPSN